MNPILFLFAPNGSFAAYSLQRIHLVRAEPFSEYLRMANKHDYERFRLMLVKYRRDRQIKRNKNPVLSLAERSL